MSLPVLGDQNTTDEIIRDLDGIARITELEKVTQLTGEDLGAT